MKFKVSLTMHVMHKYYEFPFEKRNPLKYDCKVSLGAMKAQCSFTNYGI
jgi:hypothetical protein